MNQLLDHDRRPSPRFTDKQGQYLAFIWAYAQINRRPPAEADMQRHFEVTAPTVHNMVTTLERLGLIRRQPAGAVSNLYKRTERPSVNSTRCKVLPRQGLFRLLNQCRD